MFLKKIAIALAVKYFSALLPHHGADIENEEEVADNDYYEVLGLSKNATLEDVRKAYKKKSLKLHPDKIAQRGGDPEQARIEYQNVQEAHTVLCDNKKRELYDALGRNPTLYKYISSGAYMNPQSMYENMNGSSCTELSRLFIIFVLVFGLIFLQPILIVVKVNHILDEDGGGALESTNWTALLIPTWIMHGMFVLLWFTVFVTSNGDENQIQSFFAFAEQLGWYVWEILLAMRWDGSIDWEYVSVFIPVYIAIFLKISQTIYAMSKVRGDVTRMISVQNLEENILDEGRTYEDLTQEERNELQKEFILVHVPAEHAEVEEELLAEADEEDIEEARVHSSPEFQQAMAVYYNAFESLFQTLVFWPAFIILVVLKIDGHFTESFWIVFIPVWIHLGWKILSSCYICCCATVPGGEIVLDGMDDDDSEDGENVKKMNKEVDESMKKVMESTQFAPAESDIKVPSSMPVDENESKKEKEDYNTYVPSVSSKTSTAAAATTPATTKENNASGDGGDGSTNSPALGTKQADVEESDEGEEFHIDEETYKEWQSAYEEAENSAMEAQGKAMGDGCYALFKLIIMILLVLKLEQDYENDDGDDVGFNAVWIIFPTLVVGGIILCCCACLIFCSPPIPSDTEEEDGEDNPLNQQKDEENDNNTADNNLQEAVVGVGNSSGSSEANEAQDDAPGVNSSQPAADVGYDDGLD